MEYEYGYKPKDNRSRQQYKPQTQVIGINGGFSRTKHEKPAPGRFFL